MKFILGKVITGPMGFIYTRLAILLMDEILLPFVLKVKDKIEYFVESRRNANRARDYANAESEQDRTDDFNSMP